MKLIILTLVILSNVFAALPAKSETVLEKIKRTGLLEVAMREDAIPFGYRDSNNNPVRLIFSRTVSDLAGRAAKILDKITRVRMINFMTFAEMI